MRKIAKKTWLLAGLAVFMGMSSVGATSLTGIRATNDTGRTRLVMDMDDVPGTITSRYNANTDTVTFTLGNTTNAMKEGIQYGRNTKGLLKGVAMNQRGNNLQVDITANQDIRYHAFQLNDPNRFVVDIFTDYNQKIQKEVKPGLIGYTKWSTTMPTGHVKAYVMSVNRKEPMRVGIVPEGKRITMVNAPVTTAMGLKELYSQSQTPPTLPSGSIITKPEQIMTTSQLRYTPNQGYDIQMTSPKLTVSVGADIKNIDAVNKDRGTNALVLYTPAYGTSTRTNVYGEEAVITGGKITDLHNYDTPIKKGSFILSGHGIMGDWIKGLTIGSPVTIKIESPIATITPAGTVDYQGGVPILDKGFYTGPKDTSRSARSFIGTTPEGNLIGLAVDQSGANSVGVTSVEGANLLQALGARQGIELPDAGSVDMLVNGKNDKDNGGTEKLYKEILVFP